MAFYAVYINALDAHWAKEIMIFILPQDVFIVKTDSSANAVSFQGFNNSVQQIHIKHYWND